MSCPPVLITTTPADTDANRVHAAMNDIDWPFSPRPDHVQVIGSKCEICEGEVWMSMAAASHRVALVMSGHRVYTMCFICMMVAMREDQERQGNENG